MYGLCTGPWYLPLLLHVCRCVAPCALLQDPFCASNESIATSPFANSAEVVVQCSAAVSDLLRTITDRRADLNVLYECMRDGVRPVVV
jgi:hypothetical protein